MKKPQIDGPIMRTPTAKERKVLQAFAGTPEPWGRFSGAGEVTKQALLDEGWIKLNMNTDYDPTWYEITPDGEEAAFL